MAAATMVTPSALTLFSYALTSQSSPSLTGDRKESDVSEIQRIVTTPVRFHMAYDDAEQLRTFSDFVFVFVFVGV